MSFLAKKMCAYLDFKINLVYYAGYVGNVGNEIGMMYFLFLPASNFVVDCSAKRDL